ncbi:hypothetical protein C2845_PM13G04640 [Panicum miliaceum]|uniref:IST1-like protein n=1 Tax=Panicum miliaceum TaxID=4540 RepID=A0A3L6RF70_PANMI|nr:hypothetical protein C2845_PM13G04640 [Panicum miliaceum]
MSMLDAFFKGGGGGGFRGAKCQLLVLVPFLANRLLLLLTLLQVEHIIREENMMAAQEILELFCELIAVRLPIIEAQKECPIDLKEAISSICFSAPRCADLPELTQVQMLFATKYGKEFVAAASELMPDCGVNRQIIELLSIRPPPVDAKLKLLKEIAEEHEVDWDPSETETEFLKPHEDLLNGPTYFNGSTLPLPKEKHEETVAASAAEQPDEDYESDTVKPAEPEIFTKKIDEVPPTDYMFSRQPEQVHTISHTGSMAEIDLDDVLSAAQTAAESAERAASAARAAANLAQLRIADLKKNTKSYSDGVPKGSHHQAEATQKPVFDHQDSFTNNTQDYVPYHVPQRSPSLEDDPYFSYPNLFSPLKP